MEQNKLTAKMKLVEKSTLGVVVNMGPTWFKALEKEFSKPYFIEVEICSEIPKGVWCLLCSEVGRSLYEKVHLKRLSNFFASAQQVKTLGVVIS